MQTGMARNTYQPIVRNDRRCVCDRRSDRLELNLARKLSRPFF